MIRDIEFIVNIVKQILIIMVCYPFQIDSIECPLWITFTLSDNSSTHFIFFFFLRISFCKRRLVCLFACLSICFISGPSVCHAFIVAIIIVYILRASNLFSASLATSSTYNLWSIQPLIFKISLKPLKQEKSER